MIKAMIIATDKSKLLVLYRLKIVFPIKTTVYICLWECVCVEGGGRGRGVFNIGHSYSVISV